MFGRKKKTHVETIDEVEALPRLSDEDAEIWSEPGPRNYKDVDTSEGYVDMGSILFPARPGMQLRTQVADDGTTVLQILVVLGDSGIQMSVAAAPRRGQRPGSERLCRGRAQRRPERSTRPSQDPCAPAGRWTGRSSSRVLG